MSKEKAIQFTEKIKIGLSQLRDPAHELEIDSLLGYVRILYSTIKEIETATEDLSSVPARTEDIRVTSFEAETHDSVPNIASPMQSANSTQEVPEQLNVETESYGKETSEISDMNKTADRNFQSLSELPSQRESLPSKEEPERILEVPDFVEESTVIPIIAPEETSQNETLIEAPDSITEISEKPKNIESSQMSDAFNETTEVPTTEILELSDNTVSNHIPETKDMPVERVLTSDEPPVLTPIYSLQEKTQSKSADYSSIDELFRDKHPTGLVDFLGLSPLDDIRKAWGLNDKMLIIKYLFEDDGKAFEEALITINKLTNFEEAKSYLSAQIIPRYEWNEVARYKRASEFILQVKRLFVKS